MSVACPAPRLGRPGGWPSPKPDVGFRRVPTAPRVLSVGEGERVAPSGENLLPSESGESMIIAVRLVYGVNLDGKLFRGAFETVQQRLHEQQHEYERKTTHIAHE